MNQATSGQGWGEMETTDVRKGWGLCWEGSWLGVWAAWPQEEEEEPAQKTGGGTRAVGGEGHVGHVPAGSRKVKHSANQCVLCLNVSKGCF